MSPQDLHAKEKTPAAARLSEAAAAAGIGVFFIVPVTLALAGAPLLWAAVAGYAGIAVFVGGIASRYSVIEHSSPPRQLLYNILAASAVSGFFFLLFLLVTSAF